MSATIRDDVLEVLRNLTWEGNTCKIVRDLPRRLYQKVNKVLCALGGQWDRKAKAHRFGDEGHELVADTFALRAIPDEAQRSQYYETPADLAEKMLDLAQVGPGTRMLEPSAGKGAIARPGAERGAQVNCIELHESFAPDLNGLFSNVAFADFLAEPVPREGDQFDAVVMNPPFAKSQDMRHVMHAYEFLAPGGSLVAITAPAWTFRQDRRAADFREWFHEHECYSAEELDPDTFRQSGVTVSTVLVRVVKRD